MTTPPPSEASTPASSSPSETTPPSETAPALETATPTEATTRTGAAAPPKSAAQPKASARRKATTSFDAATFDAATPLGAAAASEAATASPRPEATRPPEVAAPHPAVAEPWEATSSRKPSPWPRVAVPVEVDPDDHREQFLRAYLRHRVGDRLAALEHARTTYATALRWTTATTVLLYTGAAALGAVAVADPGGRALWGFLATAAAALATSVAVYEAAFSFRALARRSAGGVALLHLLQAHGAPEGQDGVDAFRTEAESVLRHSDQP